MEKLGWFNRQFLDRGFERDIDENYIYQTYTYKYLSQRVEDLSDFHWIIANLDISFYTYLETLTPQIYEKASTELKQQIRNGACCSE